MAALTWRNISSKLDTSGRRDAIIGIGAGNDRMDKTAGYIDDSIDADNLRKQNTLMSQIMANPKNAALLANMDPNIDADAVSTLRQNLLTKMDTRDTNAQARATSVLAGKTNEQALKNSIQEYGFAPETHKAAIDLSAAQRARENAARINAEELLRITRKQEKKDDLVYEEKQSDQHDIDITNKFTSDAMAQYYRNAGEYLNKNIPGFAQQPIAKQEKSISIRAQQQYDTEMTEDRIKTWRNAVELSPDTYDQTDAGIAFNGLRTMQQEQVQAQNIYNIEQGKLRDTAAADYTRDSEGGLLFDSDGNPRIPLPADKANIISTFGDAQALHGVGRTETYAGLNTSQFDNSEYKPLIENLIKTLKYKESLVPVLQSITDSSGNIDIEAAKKAQVWARSSIDTYQGNVGLQLRGEEQNLTPFTALPSIEAWNKANPLVTPESDTSEVPAITPTLEEITNVTPIKEVKKVIEETYGAIPAELKGKQEYFTTAANTLEEEFATIPQHILAKGGGPAMRGYLRLLRTGYKNVGKKSLTGEPMSFAGRETIHAKAVKQMQEFRRLQKFYEKMKEDHTKKMEEQDFFRALENTNQ